MKNYFLRCVSVLALFISCQSSLGAQKTVTPQMAIDVAKQLNSNSEYLYYYGKVPRVINDACGCHVTPTAFSSNPWLETQDSLWVVFIDQNPMSNWEQDCTFVYIPVNVTDLSDIPSFSVKGNRPPRHNIVDLVPWGKNGEGVNYITNTPEYVFAKEKNIGNPTIMMMIFSEEQKKATKLMWLWSTASKEGMTITSHISMI